MGVGRALDGGRTGSGRAADRRRMAGGWVADGLWTGGERAANRQRTGGGQGMDMRRRTCGGRALYRKQTVLAGDLRNQN